MHRNGNDTCQGKSQTTRTCNSTIHHPTRGIRRNQSKNKNGTPHNTRTSNRRQLSTTKKREGLSVDDDSHQDLKTTTWTVERSIEHFMYIWGDTTPLNNLNDPLNTFEHLCRHSRGTTPYRPLLLSQAGLTTCQLCFFSLVFTHRQYKQCACVISTLIYFRLDLKYIDNIKKYHTGDVADV